MTSLEKRERGRERERESTQDEGNYSNTADLLTRGDAKALQ